MKKLTYLLMLLLFLSFAACSSDDNGTEPIPEPDPWLGTWLSEGSNVAPILVNLFKYDSVKVTMNEDKTVKLETHIQGGAWSEINGVFNVTKSTTGDVHSISIDYSAFAQSGIVQIIKGTPDQMKLEVVQTTPDIGAVPRTPQSGFGSDPALGNLNIQVYVRLK